MQKNYSLFILLFISTISLNARTTCRDFDTQAQAQRYYEERLPYWKKLDGDHDGEACECLYGGSAYEKSICVRWREKYGKK